MPTPLQQQQRRSATAAVAVRRSLEDWLPRGAKAGAAPPTASPSRRGKAARDENAQPERQVSVSWRGVWCGEARAGAAWKGGAAACDGC